MGVELKAMSGEPNYLPRFQKLIRQIRKEYSGELVYSANWDEIDQVLFWKELDYAGVNGYFPLIPDPSRGAEKVARTLHKLSQKAEKPVLVIEAGYRSSPLSYRKPWQWPEEVDPIVDQTAQAQAWAAVLTHWLDAPGIRGLMVWVIASDPDNPAAEAPHGFSPMNKQAEGVISQAFQKVQP